MKTFTQESARNRQAYEELRETIRRDYAGQYVALAHGKIIGSSRSFDSARDLVNQLQPAPEYFLVFLAGMEPDFELIYDLAGSV
jgi:hypothetical protein